MEKYKEILLTTIEKDDMGLKLEQMFKKYNSMSPDEQYHFMRQVEMYKNSETLIRQLQNNYLDDDYDDSYEFRNPYLNTNR